MAKIDQGVQVAQQILKQWDGQNAFNFFNINIQVESNHNGNGVDTPLLADAPPAHRFMARYKPDLALLPESAGDGLYEMMEGFPQPRFHALMKAALIDVGIKCKGNTAEMGRFFGVVKEAVKRMLDEYGIDRSIFK